MALHYQSAATINLFRPLACGGVVRLSTPAWRASASAVRFFPAKGRSQGATTSLRSRAYDPEKRWWKPQLHPEDPIEPTGNGVEEMKAIRDALIREPLQPVWLAVQEIVATRGNLFRCRCFHAGIVSCPLLLVAGLCKLYTVAPILFIDIVLGYIFYKLSVLAAHLSRNGKASNICTRIQQVIVAIMFFQCTNPVKDFYYHFTYFLWTINIQVYAIMLYCECVGIKYPRQEWEGICIEIVTRFKGMLSIIVDLIRG